MAFSSKNRPQAATRLSIATKSRFWLATSAYSRLLKPFVTKNQRLIDIVFQENKNGRWRTAATHVKMSRGDMVRFMAERAVTDAE